MTRQRLRLDQVVVPAGTPDGHLATVSAGGLLLAPPPAGGGGSSAGGYTFDTSTLVSAGFTRDALSSGNYSNLVSTFFTTTAVQLVSVTIDVYESDTHEIYLDETLIGSELVTGPVDGAVVECTPTYLAPGAHRVSVQTPVGRRIYYRRGGARPSTGTGARFVPWWEELASANLPALRLDFYGSTFTP